MATSARKKKPKSADVIHDSPAAELLAFARTQAQSGMSSTELHNAVYGIGGKFSQLFTTQSERAQFAKSPEFKAIAELIGSQRAASADTDEVPSGKFVLRLPASLHAALLAEAKAEGVSLNQLCLAKLSTQLQATIR